MRSSFLPKCQPKIWRISALPSNKHPGQKSFKFLVWIMNITIYIPEFYLLALFINSYRFMKTYLYMSICCKNNQGKKTSNLPPLSYLMLWYWWSPSYKKPVTAAPCNGKVLIYKSYGELFLLVQLIIQFVYLAYFDPKKYP